MTTLTSAILNKYKTNVFFETGTYKGEGIQLALNCEINNIISIEICKEYYEANAKAYDKLIKQNKVTLHFGDTLDVMPKILPNIHDKITFWLDAHTMIYECNITGKTMSPIIEELDIINNTSRRKDNVIMIDDMRIFKSKDGWASKNNYGIKDIEAKIKQINPNYKITYEGNREAPDDILVAYL